jgi:hypothetical protein
MSCSAELGQLNMASVRSSAHGAHGERAWRLRSLLCLFYVLLLTAPARALDVGAFTSHAFRRLDRVPGDALVPLAIALTPRDFETLERTLYSVSDPQYVFIIFMLIAGIPGGLSASSLLCRSTAYGRHLTKQQADALGAPDARALEALRAWVEPFADPSSPTRFSETTNTLHVRYDGNPIIIGF